MNSQNKYNIYSTFSAIDFIQDQSFQNFIIHSNNKEQQEFWTGFLRLHPEKKEVIETAAECLKRVSFKADFPDEALLQQMLSEHLTSIEKLKQKDSIKLNRVHVFKTFLKAAAIFGGVTLLVFSLFTFLNKDKKVFAKTTFGKIKSVTLPDDSRVILNANSAIEYSKEWNNKKREVWLEGEAFFDVKHLNKDAGNVKPNEVFLLHAKGLTIEVLGTSFDVRQRRGNTEVVLQTGRIKIVFDDAHQQSILMTPGDILTYDPGQNQITKTRTNPENYISWKEKKLRLNNPTVNEIVEYLEDNYGRKIILQKPEIGMRKIEGPILLNNLDDALFILSTVLHSEVTERDSTFVIHPRN